MKILCLFVCLILLGAHSCKRGGSNSSIKSGGTVGYTYKKLIVYDKNCINKDKCSFVKITFPIFQQLPQLNDTVMHQVLDYLYTKNGIPENLNTGFKEFTNDFFKDMSRSKTANPSTLELAITTVTQDPNFVVLKITDVFSGGAHPNENDSFINWSKKKDRIINLEDILIDGYKRRLAKIAEKIFRENESLKPSESLTKRFFWNHTFALNNNFRITSEGLSFFYNRYEIKSYSEGPATLLIPYSQIKSLLLPNTVVSQYIK